MNQLASAMVACVGLSLSPFATSASASFGGDDNQDFTVFWAVNMFQEVQEGTGGRNWQADFDFGGAPISRDVIFLTQARVGAFPRPGIHLYEADPAGWNRHMAKLRRDIPQYVSEDFNGIVVIDYETWRPYWERTRNQPGRQNRFGDNLAFLDLWHDTIKQTRAAEYNALPASRRQQFVYDTYDEVSLRFFMETLQECKRLRPNAQWTYFNFPKLRYYSNETPRGTIGYGDLTHEASRINNKIQALYDEMDVIVPSIYPQHWTVEGNSFVSFLPRNRQNRTHATEQFVSSMVAEARRLGGDKPVVPIISLRYYIPVNLPERLWLNDMNIRCALSASAEAGASGLMLWEGIGTRREYTQLQSMVLERLAPAVIDLVGGDTARGGNGNGRQQAASSSASPSGSNKVITGVSTFGRD
jgi:hypothetical protein